MNMSLKRQRQRGAVLAVGLVLLLLATIVTFVSMRSSHMQEQMAANTNHKAVAFMAAEFGAAEFREWLLEELEAAGVWLDNDAWNAQTEMPTTEASSRQAGDGLGRFWFTDVAWTSDRVSLVSVGQAVIPTDILGEARVLVEFDAPAFGDGGFSPPPAAISCLGGGCALIAGSSAINKIDGRDHAVPPDTKSGVGCSGSGCWMTPSGSGQPPAPSVFLNDRSASSIGGGNPANSPFCGANNDLDSDLEVVCGRTINMGSAWDPSHYSDDPVTGESTAPTVEQYFGVDSAFHDVLNGSGSPEWGTWEEPKVTYYDPAFAGNPTGNENNAGVLIIDGFDYNRSGTGLFAGVVVVTGCGTVGMGGNFNIYGGILIDARGCPAGYDPFAGNGTPSVRFSSEAITTAGALFRTVGELAVRRWYERL